MGTLRRAEGLRGCSVDAADGHFGHVADVCFDDHHWLIRHLLVNMERTLPDREVLLPPSSLSWVDWKRRTLTIELTRQQAASGTTSEAMRQAMAPCHVHREPQLHMCGDVIGCDVLTSDEPIGHIDDLIFDEEHWRIVSMVVDTRNWWPGRKILISPRRIVRASWPAMMVIVDVTRGEFETANCKNSNCRFAERSRV